MAEAQLALSQGRELATAGKHLEALVHLRRAQELFPDWALPYLEEAQSLMVLEATEAEVARALARAEKLAPNTPRVYYALGLFHENYGRDALAMGVYQHALKLRPTYPEALFRLALLQERTGKLAAAKQSFESAALAQPENVGATLGLVRVAERLGDQEAAIRGLRELIRRYPGRVRYQTMLAELLERQQRHDQARKVRQAIDAQLTESQGEKRPLKPSRR